MLNIEVQKRLIGAFPSDVSVDDEVLAIIPPGTHAPSLDDVGPVFVQSEWLHIPARVYFDEPDEDKQLDLSEHQRNLLSCIYSRHHSGYVREAHLRKIIRTDLPWVVPFVVQLIGEYVIEILHVTEANIDIFDRPVYRQFVATNPTFLSLTRARVISYWNEYHRRQIANFEAYVGWRLLAALGYGRAVQQSGIAGQ